MSRPNYNIRFLNNHRVSQGLYFFDANIWIFVLRPPNILNSKKRRYIEFFENVFSAEDARIAVTSTLLSEVINVILREISWALYSDERGEDHSQKNRRNFKSEYRGTEHCKEQYELICDDIAAYKDKFVLLNDEFGTGIGIDELLKPSATMDFNDYHFYLLALKHECVFITDDGDFFCPDLQILTHNHRLIDRANNVLIQHN